ncbi:MAG: acylneuraminate cytidylyltransferase family protein [Phycisphaerae bacterium]|jgi:CMP-N-acetylneuraminic acid synthetase
MKILAIIPARGGSKGIEKKNIIDLCGRPLLDYTIKPALEVLRDNIISEVIVSTDCAEIAGIAQKSGVKVPFLRPKELAGDKSPSVEYVLHALDFYQQQGIVFDTVLILQPTAPLRTYEDMKNSVKLFSNHSCDTLISAYKEEKLSDLIMYHCRNNFGIALNKDHNKAIRRQDQNNIYVRNGAIYIATAEFVRKMKKLISDLPLLYEMPKSRSVNIDSYEDLETARNILCK